MDPKIESNSQLGNLKPFQLEKKEEKKTSPHESQIEEIFQTSHHAIDTNKSLPENSKVSKQKGSSKAKEKFIENMQKEEPLLNNIYTVIAKSDDTADSVIIKENIKFAKSILIQMKQAGLTELEKEILNDLLHMELTPHQMREVLKGAHVRLSDDGSFYEKWKELGENKKGFRERISSHPSIAGSKQYGIEGPCVHEFLFGIVEDKGEKKTFFQLENTPWAPGAKNRLGHIIDAISYKATGQNIGPYGSSPHVDKKPIHHDVAVGARGEIRLSLQELIKDVKTRRGTLLFTNKQSLTQGSQGIVETIPMVTNTGLNETLILKSIKTVMNNIDTIASEDLNREHNILIKLSKANPDFINNILRTPEHSVVYKNKQGDVFAGFIMKKAESDIGEYIQNKILSNEEKLKIITSLAEDFAFFEEQGLLHGDIKPANCLFLNGVAYFSDFGSAKFQNEISQFQDLPSGTKEYYPIEERYASKMQWQQSTSQEEKQKIIKSAGEKADALAFGLLCYQILLNKNDVSPYKINKQNYIVTVDEGKFCPFEGTIENNENKLENCGADPALINLVKKMCSSNPAERLSGKEFLSQLHRS